MTDWRTSAFVLICTAVLVGLIGMHHLSIASGDPVHVGADSAEIFPTVTISAEPAMATDRGPLHGEHPESGHDMALQHLCLAVLTIAAAVVLGMLVALAVAPASPSPLQSPGWNGSAPRAPPLPTRVRLALLCVLRN
ncbi:DUF6153 family protein [Pseudonocardia sp. GCM10023141]|uniref:DUF6153 family protein n=1 Tax=Pseudonocardia sp. GCM10023141 TaxID=3252653 RepID=UPI0036193F0C